MLVSLKPISFNRCNPYIFINKTKSILPIFSCKNVIDTNCLHQN
uniref:Uncharacterized protein n=1 Tax=Arundo donax TaxID=35708 RepID=A0A0A9DXY0_ARUDO